MSVALMLGSATDVAVRIKSGSSLTGILTVGFSMAAFENVTPEAPASVSKTDHLTVIAPPAGLEAEPAKVVELVPEGRFWSSPAYTSNAPTICPDLT